MHCSFFANFSTVSENHPVLAILDSIRDGSLCGERINELRSLLAQGKTDEFSQRKKQLPAFTPSGIFNKTRCKENLSLYSGLIHLDLDHVPEAEFEQAIAKACSCEYTFALFKSPSGAGCKIFVRVISGSVAHEQAYKTVSAFYETMLGHTPDPSCKDVSRLCFGSYDPNLYFNENSVVFDIFKTETLSPQTHSTQAYPVIENPAAAFESAVKFTEQKHSYQQGMRNNFIHALACNCNRQGIPMDDTLPLIQNRYDLSASEIKSAVASAYSHNGNEFAKFANTQNDQPDSDFMLSTPLIPPQVYESLPQLLQTACTCFSDARERDVFLTGALSVVSGCLPGVWGVYDQKTVFPNLFSFVVAPAASGKGSMSFAKQLADHYHQSLLKSSEADKEAYTNEMEEFRVRQRQRNSIVGPVPEEPPFKVLFIPANASQAKILQHLKENNDSSIICETEADSMSNALKQDWGNYSDMLRKAFHHECISSSKKTNNEYIEVRQPKLSVALSGTPNQVAKLISSAEDGLFSRFLFYVFKSNLGWKDVSPGNCSINLTEHFSDLSKTFYNMVLFLKNNQTEVLLTTEQWNLLNEKFGSMLSLTTAISGEDSASIVKRLGLILYRIIMIFSAVRKFEKQDKTVETYCTDSDFETGLLLTNTYLEHSLLLFSNLPKQGESKSFSKGSKKQIIFSSLPDEFKRIDAVELGKQQGLSPRTIDDLLKSACSAGTLSQHKTGYYNKTLP